MISNVSRKVRPAFNSINKVVLQIQECAEVVVKNTLQSEKNMNNPYNTMKYPTGISEAERSNLR